jgi:hypothetical protein
VQSISRRRSCVSWPKHPETRAWINRYQPEFRGKRRNRQPTAVTSYAADVWHSDQKALGLELQRLIKASNKLTGDKSE